MEGTLKGITLLEDYNQQLMMQYADNTNYTLLVTKANLRAISSLLQDFHLAFRLQTNWLKSYGYCFLKNSIPIWLKLFLGQWTLAGSFSKLLDIPFGLNL